MAARYSSSIIFVPVLALLLALTASFFLVYAGAVMHATAEDPQTVAGAAQFVGATTPAEDRASVTTGTLPLSPSEEARPLPQGQPR
jgi:hypothetical protein